MAYITNVKDIFDLETLYKQIQSSNGDFRSFEDKYFDFKDEDFAEIAENWKNAGYEKSSIEWYNYYSGEHFLQEFAEKFSEIFNAKPVKVWVSKINPGKCFPYHWDADKDKSRYVEGKMVRYHMHIKDYSFGHFFILEDEYISGYTAGDVYKWKDHTVWHAGGNIGAEPKYIFNFLGVIND